MLKRIEFVFTALVVSPLVVSCVQDVILDARDEPQVVVDCILSDEPVQTLYLIYTKGASRETAPELTDAVATLIDLTEGKEAGRFQRTTDGSWQLAYAAAPEHTYRLEVSVPDHVPIWAEQTMPRIPNIRVAFKPFLFEPHFWTGYEHIGGFMGGNNGYEFSIDSPRDPVWFYGINYPTADSPGERTALLCTDYPEVDDFNLDKTVSSHGKYGLFDECSFWGNSYFRTTTYPDLVGCPLHYNYLRFPANDNIGTEFYISGSFQGYLSDVSDFVHAEKRPAELHWLAVSEDYDIYIKSSDVLLGFKTSSDMADMFLRDNVYSNIHGAIGLFGAKIEDRIEWEGSLTEFENRPFMLQGFHTLHEHGYELPVEWRPPYTQFDLRAYGGFEDSPFELFLFEIWKGEPWPDWVSSQYPDLASSQYGESHVITDESQLQELGLGQYGTVDFAKKTVLLYLTKPSYQFPYSIGYGRIKSDYQRVNIWEESFSADQYCPFLTWQDLSVIVADGDIRHVDPFAYRIAIIVDKQESIFPRWCTSQLNGFSLYDDPKEALRDWDNLVDVFSWNK